MRMDVRVLRGRAVPTSFIAMQARGAELEVQVASLRQEVAELRMVLKSCKQREEVKPLKEGTANASETEQMIRSDAVEELAPSSENGHVNVSPMKHHDTPMPVCSNPAGMVEYWKQMYREASERLQDLQEEVSLVQLELADERHVHDLRSLADSARKLEIQELQAVQGRADINIEYLKNVLLGFFESGELPLNKQVLIVLDRLMLFTPQDRARIWKAEGKSHNAGWVSSLFK